MIRAAAVVSYLGLARARATKIVRVDEPHVDSTNGNYTHANNTTSFCQDLTGVRLKPEAKFRIREAALNTKALRPVHHTKDQVTRRGPVYFTNCNYNLTMGIMGRVLILPKHHVRVFGEEACSTIGAIGKITSVYWLKAFHDLLEREPIFREPLRIGSQVAWMAKRSGTNRAYYAKQTNRAREVLRTGGSLNAGYKPSGKMEGAKPHKPQRIIQAVNDDMAHVQLLLGPGVEAMTARLKCVYSPGHWFTYVGGMSGDTVGKIFTAKIFMYYVRKHARPTSTILLGVELTESELTEIIRLASAMTRSDRRAEARRLYQLALQITRREGFDWHGFYTFAATVHTKGWDIPVCDGSMQLKFWQLYYKLAKKSGYDRDATDRMIRSLATRGRSGDGAIEYEAGNCTASGGPDTAAATIFAAALNYETALVRAKAPLNVQGMGSGDDGLFFGDEEDLVTLRSHYPEESGLTIEPEGEGPIWGSTFLGSLFVPTEHGFMPVPPIGRLLFKLGYFIGEKPLGRYMSSLQSQFPALELLGWGPWAIRELERLAHMGVTPWTKPGDAKDLQYKVRLVGSHPRHPMTNIYLENRYGILPDPLTGLDDVAYTNAIEKDMGLGPPTEFGVVDYLSFAGKEEKDGWIRQAGTQNAKRNLANAN